MKNLPVIHPFLFAISPILFLFYFNIGEVSFSEILLPSAIVLGMTVLLLLLSKLLFKDYKKGGLIISIFLVLFFSYGHVLTIIAKSPNSKIRFWGAHRFLVPLWILLIAGCTYITIRILKDLRNLTSILNIVALSLVAISIFNIGINQFKTINSRKDNSNHNYIKSLEDGGTNIIKLRNGAKPPHIYYIILDEYARSSTLLEYGFDNQEFIDYLTKKGFYVASKSRSNYAQTLLSLSSSLNMKYINFLSDLFGEGSKDKKSIMPMLLNNKVKKLLKTAGYKYIDFSMLNIESDIDQFKALNFHRLNKKNYRSDISFLWMLIHTSMLRSIERHFLVHVQRETVLKKFANIAKVPEIKEPTFVYAHFICPHAPYIFGANGEKVSKPILSKRKKTRSSHKQLYINQLVYINKLLRIMIDEILSKSEFPPIIILQGDTGPLLSLGSTKKRETWSDPTDEMLKERMSIFNAYYLPSGGKDLLYDSISPVNTFRIIFNRYFDTNYEILEDQSYFSAYYRPYKFINVTEKVD